jgi:hypothetical protein
VPSAAASPASISHIEEGQDSHRRSQRGETGHPGSQDDDASRDSRSELAKSALTLGVIVRLVAANGAAFSAWSETDYLHWYLANGPLISVVFTFLVVAWGSREGGRPHLGAAAPQRVIQACRSSQWPRLAALTAALVASAVLGGQDP